ncbi:hypothetical protein JL193_01875 [Polaribacter batillariae]|uniref:Uncharacterized protein n=1 Tax=Polaribacter batillariae TaxID=2808900 RepID=A0ABX7SX79_9FLAO|nr:hypothetical protein [Polaribacter batillariae]QTD38078.1 hypothetical protein JL193_01875 [Polaribacter batillariae]
MKNEKINKLLVILNLALVCSIVLYHYSLKNRERDFSNDVLKVRGIVIVDSLGVERAILAAHLPEAQRDGGRMFSSRSQTSVSGLMLYDSEGMERGGFVTDDDYGNIFMTLDPKGDQTALFLAEPQGATTMSIWSRSGNKASFTASESELAIDLVENGKKFKIKNND